MPSAESFPASARSTSRPWHTRLAAPIRATRVNFSNEAENDRSPCSRPRNTPQLFGRTMRPRDGRAGAVFACIGERPVDLVFCQEQLTLELGVAAFRSLP